MTHHVLTRGIVAALMLAVASAGARSQDPGHKPLAPAELAAVQKWSTQLVSDLEYLLEDVRIDLDAASQQKIYQQANQAMESVTHFRKTLRPDIGREHVAKDFADADGQIHTLLQTIQALGQGASVLQRGVARVGYSDKQLHFAVFGADQSPVRQAETIARQAHALQVESRELARWSALMLRPFPQGQAATAAFQKYAEDAEHFHKAIEKGGDANHVKNDFAALDQSWHNAVNELNRIGGKRQSYLARRVQRVEQINENLHRVFGLPGQRPVTEYR